MESNPGKAYRPLPDQASRAASYRAYRIVGKLLLFLVMLAAFFAVAVINRNFNFSLWFLFVIPLALLVALFWKGFPAFCRCPGCGKKMRSRSVEARREGAAVHYLVCERCELSVFLGEEGTGD